MGKWTLLFIALTVSPIVVSSGEDEWTKTIHEQLPFLIKGTHFWDVYPGNNPGHGETHRLYGEMPTKPKFEIRTSAGLSRFVTEIQTTSHAMRYVRFLSGGSHQFADVPFHEIVHNGFGNFSLTAMKQAGLTAPKVSKEILSDGQQVFIIERFVLTPEDLANASKTRQSDPYGDKVTLREISKVRECVTSRGVYSFSRQPFKVNDLKGFINVALLD